MIERYISLKNNIYFVVSLKYLIIEVYDYIPAIQPYLLI